MPLSGCTLTHSSTHLVVFRRTLRKFRRVSHSSFFLPAFAVSSLFGVFFYVMGVMEGYFNTSESVYNRCNTVLVNDVLPEFPRSLVF